MSQESSPKGETDGTRPRQRSTAIKRQQEQQVCLLLCCDKKQNTNAACFSRQDLSSARKVEDVDYREETYTPKQGETEKWNQHLR